MRHFSVFQSLVLILAIIALSFCVVSAIQVWWLRGTIIEEREHKTRDMVESVVHLAKAYDDEVKAGRLTLPRRRKPQRRRSAPCAGAKPMIISASISTTA